jgi:diguanylate cyclase (GGDEF)-like protein/PAS domain S-box-containing protein
MSRPHASPTKAKPALLSFDPAESDALIRALMDVVLVFDRDGRYLKIGMGDRRAFYRSADVLLGRTILDVFPRERATHFLGLVRQAIDTGNVQRTEYSLEHDGRERYFQAVISPTHDGTCVWVARDVTEQRDAETSARASEATLQDLLASLPIVVYWSSPVAPYSPMYVSQGIAGMGYTVDEWMDEPDMWLRSIHPDDRDRAIAEIDTALAGASRFECEYRLISKHGKIHWVSDRGEFLRDDRGAVLARRGVRIDITERRALEERLAALSEEDELTGLLNRRGFRRMAEQGLKIEQRSGRRVALIYFDVDAFKSINDTYGHGEGDRALRTVAGVLRSSVRDGDLVGRIGGDEFVVLAVGIEGEWASAQLADRIRAAIASSAPAAPGGEYSLAVSFGIAEASSDDSLDALLDRADKALYATRGRTRARG